MRTLFQHSFSSQQFLVKIVDHEEFSSFHQIFGKKQNQDARASLYLCRWIGSYCPRKVPKKERNI